MTASTEPLAGVTPSVPSAQRFRLWAGPTYLALGAIVALICAPLLWMLLAAFKTRAEIYTLPVAWLPAELRWNNFRQAWTAVPFDRYLVNSLVTTLVGSGLKVANGVLTAYALAFLNFPRKNLVLLFVLAALM